jgi:hypothetical protein
MLNYLNTFVKMYKLLNYLIYLPWKLSWIIKMFDNLMQWYNEGITTTSLTIDTSNFRWKYKIILDEFYLFPIIQIFLKI